MFVAEQKTWVTFNKKRQWSGTPDSTQKTLSPFLVKGLGLGEPAKGPDLPNPKPCKTPRKKWRFIVMGDSLLGDTEAPMISHLERFAACQEPGSGMLWRHCRSSSSSLTTRACCYCIWAQMILPGETWTVSKVTTELRGQGMGAQVLLSSILPVRGKGARRRTLIGQVSNCLWNWCWGRVWCSMTTGLCLQISVCLGEIGSTSLSRAKLFLPTGWLTS